MQKEIDVDGVLSKSIQKLYGVYEYAKKYTNVSIGSLEVILFEELVNHPKFSRKVHP